MFTIIYIISALVTLVSGGIWLYRRSTAVVGDVVLVLALALIPGVNTIWALVLCVPPMLKYRIK